MSGVDYMPGQIIIMLKESSEAQAHLAIDSSDNAVRMGLTTLDSLHARKGVLAIGESPARHVSSLADRRYVLKIPKGEEQNLVGTYAANEHIALASLNYLYLMESHSMRGAVFTPMALKWLA